MKEMLKEMIGYYKMKVADIDLKYRNLVFAV